MRGCQSVKWPDKHAVLLTNVYLDSRAAVFKYVWDLEFCVIKAITC